MHTGLTKWEADRINEPARILVALAALGAGCAAQVRQLDAYPSVHVGAGDAVGLDERSVQDDVSEAVGLALHQHVVQVWDFICENVSAFVEVAVAGGLGDPGAAGRAVHTSANVAQALAEGSFEMFIVPESGVGRRAAP
ncbi:hypothetical protein [Streptomyces sp. NPDC002619]|uniref:hypothetical protein n=1 Tax=Streptomyces sp. NPDC002619 TaxID=3364655 RepID=UPI0036A579FF